MNAQKTFEGYHPVLGYRLVHNEPFYPSWTLEVMDATVTDTVSLGLLSEGNLKDALLAFSLKYPGKQVAATSMARHRAVALDGEIVKERKYADFYHVTDDIEAEEERIFDGMLLADHDGMGGYLTTK